MRATINQKQVYDFFVRMLLALAFVRTDEVFDTYIKIKSDKVNYYPKQLNGQELGNFQDFFFTAKNTILEYQFNTIVEIL